jgi:hypothetical protein
VEDDDSVSQDVGFIQMVSAQEDGASFTVLDDQIPDASSGGGVDATGRLIENHRLRSSDESQRNGQPPLLTTRQLTGSDVHRRAQTHKIKQLLHLVLLLFL